jgi:hypothetical protein
MRQPRRFHRAPEHPVWMDILVVWLAIGLVLFLNLILMWRIATATG